MIQPSKDRFDEDPDELGIELPPIGSLNDEEAWQPEDDSDLDLDDDADLGLDAALGLDDEDDQGESDEGEDDPNEGSWLEQGELGAGLPGDDELAEGEADESGLTEGSEPAGGLAEEFADDDLILDERDERDREDSGQEGFDDDNTLSDLDLERLPPLDDAMAADAEDQELDAFGAELLGVVPESAHGDEPQPAVSPADVRIDTLLPTGPALSRLCATRGAGVAWNGVLLVAEASTSRAEVRFGEAESVLSMAALQLPAGLFIALVTPSGLLVSRDGGRRFGLAAGLPHTEPGMDRVALTAGDQGPRLWVAGPRSGLWVSDDLGADFREAQAASGAVLAVDEERGLVMLGRDAAEPRTSVARRSDFQTYRDLVLCCRHEPFAQVLWQQGPNAWQVLPGATPPAALVHEGNGASVYFVTRQAERRRLVRRELIPILGADQIVGELPPSAGLPSCLAAAHDRGSTSIQLGAERAWIRFVLRTGSSRHAT